MTTKIPKLTHRQRLIGDGITIILLLVIEAAALFIELIIFLALGQ